MAYCGWKTFLHFLSLVWTGCLWSLKNRADFFPDNSNVDWFFGATESHPEFLYAYLLAKGRNATRVTQHHQITYQLLVRFHQEMPSFVHDPNPLAPINQGIALFLDLLNSAPSLNWHHEPGDESTPEPARCVGHLVVPAHCADVSAIVRTTSTAR